MKTRMLSILIILILITGCTTASEISVEMLQNNGSYHLPNLEWGISRAEAEERLGHSLDRFFAVVYALTTEDDPGLDYDNGILLAQEKFTSVKLNDHTGIIAYQFQEGTLVYVGIYFQNTPADKLDEIRSSLLEWLTETYGDPQRVSYPGFAEGSSSFFSQSETHEWKADDGSRLCLITTFNRADNATRTVRIGLSAR